MSDYDDRYDVMEANLREGFGYDLELENEVERLRAALVEERARYRWEVHWLHGGVPWEGDKCADDKERCRHMAESALIAEGLLPLD